MTQVLLARQAYLELFFFFNALLVVSKARFIASVPTMMAVPFQLAPDLALQVVAAQYAGDFLTAS
jgi:hypothetical protein